MLLESRCYRAYLNEELARRTQAHPRYSQRAFARDLGMSPGELSEVLGAKRRLSVKSALRIARALDLNPTETRHLLYLVQLETAGGEPSIPPTEWRALGGSDAEAVDRFRLVADWFCFAILNLSQCEGFRPTERWIARRLGLSEAQVRVALGRLERAGLAARKAGRWHFPAGDVALPGGVPSEAVRSHHRQMLQLAARALDVQGVEEREIAGVGFPLDPRDLPSLKRDVAQFLDEMVARYSRGKHRREVYQLELALFRLTQGGDDAH